MDLLDGRTRGQQLRNSTTSEQSDSPTVLTESEDDLEPSKEDEGQSTLDPSFLESWELLLTWKSQLDFKALKGYLTAIGSRITTSKVGYFLENHFQNLGLKSVHLSSLKPRCERPRLWKKGVRGNLNYRWMLRIPGGLAEESQNQRSAPGLPRLKSKDCLKDKNLLRRLQQDFGSRRFPAFRPGQEALIRDVLDGLDAMGVIPTGAGKSLTFQFPSTLLNGLTLVIMPLIALMNDQLRKATDLGVKALSHRQLGNVVERERAIGMIQEGSLNVLFISPEALFPLLGSLAILKERVVQIVVDEAHTMLSWGKDFRFSMQKLKRLRDIWPNTPILALTATATPDDRKEIMSELGFRMDTQPYVGTTFRKALYLQHQVTSNDFNEKLSALVAFIRIQDEHRGEQVCGIVYCNSRDETERVAHELHQIFGECPSATFESGVVIPDSFGAKKRSGKKSTFCLPHESRVQCYHAGLADGLREQSEALFMSRKDAVLVATVAFGMGIDKDNIRFVANFGPPSSINEYVQQVGRAGRDGKDAECLLLHSPQDWDVWVGHLNSSKKKIERHAESTAPHILREKRTRLGKRRDEFAHLKRLIWKSGCFHQAIGAHFGEAMDTCQEHCAKCQLPEIHRLRWRESRESQVDLGEAMSDLDLLEEGFLLGVESGPPQQEPEDFDWDPNDLTNDIELPDLDEQPDGDDLPPSE